MRETPCCGLLLRPLPSELPHQCAYSCSSKTVLQASRWCCLSATEPLATALYAPCTSPHSASFAIASALYAPCTSPHSASFAIASAPKANSLTKDTNKREGGFTCVRRQDGVLGKGSLCAQPPAPAEPYALVLLSHLHSPSTTHVHKLWSGRLRAFASLAELAVHQACSKKDMRACMYKHARTKAHALPCHP